MIKWLTSIFLFMLLACTAQAADNISQSSGMWTNPAVWSDGVPTPDDDVYIQSGHSITTTGLSTNTVTSLSITGLLTHAVGTANACILNISNDLFIATNGSINVNQKGALSTGTGGHRASAGHGGEGRPSPSGAGGTTYGSITNPVLQGSYSESGYGGGLVILNIGGSLTNNGTMISKGVDSNGARGAASGGSINITADSMDSSGTINVNGGDGDGEGSWDAGGGGGRIAIRLTGGGETFSGVNLTNVTAYGGPGDPDPFKPAAGTIYLKTAAQTYGDVIVKNNNQFSSVTTLIENQTNHFDTITTVDYGIFVLGTNTVLDLTGCILVSDTPVPTITSRLVVKGASLLMTGSWTNDGTISFAESAEMCVTGSITVASGGILTHESGGSSSIDVQLCGDLTIDSGGYIWLEGRGYVGSPYPGGGRYGGGHGGQGGWGYNISGPPSEAYDSVTNPVISGGGGTGSGNGYGGGAVVMHVSGAVVINGIIDADGIDTTSHLGGGGAGGTINVTAATISGSGSLLANGGDGVNLSGGGGGGRISIALTNSSSFGNITMSAAGGSADSIFWGAHGGGGTIYLKDTNQVYGLLIVSNAQAVADSTTTPISQYVTDAVVGDVHLFGTTKFAVDSGQAMSIYGSWSNAASGGLSGDGEWLLAGASAVSVYGDNSFGDLTITNSGKTVSFNAGDTQTVRGTPTFNNVTLQSTSAGTRWELVKSQLPNQVVGVVSVQDSDASGGCIWHGAAGSLNSGNNINWLWQLKYIPQYANAIGSQNRLWPRWGGAQAAAAGVQATGGTVTNYSDGGTDYRAHIFLSSGTFDVTSGGDVEYLVIAGGGGGGRYIGGGGGAGGFLTGSSNVIVTTYPIVIGNGGAGATAVSGTGFDGADSSFSAATAVGGGGGGGYNGTYTGPTIGGSGGGGSHGQTAPELIGAAGTAGQGYAGGDGTWAGGYNAGGGGGASAIGGDGVNGIGGKGGDGADGILSSINGSSVYYAGGGGGGGYYGSSSTKGFGGNGGGGDGTAASEGTGVAGLANTGGGGGGGGDGLGGTGYGGAGGSGIVVIRYTR